MHLMKLSDATAGQRVRLVAVTTTGQHPQRYDIADDEWNVCANKPSTPRLFKRLRAVRPDPLSIDPEVVLGYAEVGINEWVFVGDDQ